VSTDYPLDLLSEDGSTIRFQLVADFTDPSNAPLGPGTVTVADIDAEDSDAGQVIESNGDGTASWTSPAGGSARVVAQVNITGAAELTLGQTPTAGNFSTLVSIQGPPIISAAMGGICGLPSVAPADIPNISDAYDCNVTLYVTDALGTNTLTVSGGSSQATPIVGVGADIDWTGTTATIVGADLTWSDTAGPATTAGGVYSVTVLANGGPD
jgi:hypothetical protein